VTGHCTQATPSCGNCAVAALDTNGITVITAVRITDGTGAMTAGPRAADAFYINPRQRKCTK
jgi:hypothetical protein